MDTVITKAKPWAQQIKEMDVTETLPFPATDVNYIQSLVSGPYIKGKFPLRNYTTSTEKGITKVTRLEDTVI